MMGGIDNLKHHLARIARHDVDLCPNASPKAMRDAHQSIYEKDKKKEDKVAFQLEIVVGVARNSRTTSISMTRESQRDSMDSPSTRISPFFVSRTRLEQTSIKSVVKKKKT